MTAGTSIGVEFGNWALGIGHGGLGMGDWALGMGHGGLGLGVMGSIFVRQARLEDTSTVSDILHEAALWLKQKDMPLWGEDEVSSEGIFSDVEAGLFYIAFSQDSPAGVVKFQTEDPLFWSDIPNQDSGFIHRLAVKRSFAGGS